MLAACNGSVGQRGHHPRDTSRAHAGPSSTGWRWYGQDGRTGRCPTTNSSATVPPVEFELKELARVIDGYSATFQMGMVTHVESGVDEAVVEDEPPTPALSELIRRVQAVFAGMT